MRSRPIGMAASPRRIPEIAAMLEQITNMANATSSLATETRDARAVGMLGKTVGWIGPEGIRQEGDAAPLLLLDVLLQRGAEAG